MDLIQTVLPWQLQPGHAFNNAAVYKPLTPIANWDPYDHITVPYKTTNGIITTHEGYIHTTARVGATNQIFKYDFSVSNSALTETSRGGLNCDRKAFLLPSGSLAAQPTGGPIARDPALKSLWENTKALKNISVHATNFWTAFLAAQPQTAFRLSKIGVLVIHRWGASIKVDLELLHKGSSVRKLRSEGNGYSFFTVAQNTSLQEYGLRVTYDSTISEINKIDLDTRYLLRDTNYSIDFSAEQSIPV